MRKLLAAIIGACALAAALAACGGPDDCKSGCDKLKTCDLKSSGFSCDTACSTPQEHDCSGCLTDSTCDEIVADACAHACPGAKFTK